MSFAANYRMRAIISCGLCFFTPFFTAANIEELLILSDLRNQIFINKQLNQPLFDSQQTTVLPDLLLIVKCCKNKIDKQEVLNKNVGGDFS